MVLELLPALVLTAAAMLSKEQGITVLGVCAVMDVCLCVLKCTESLPDQEAKLDRTENKNENDQRRKEEPIVSESGTQWRWWHILFLSANSPKGLSKRLRMECQRLLLDQFL